MFNFGIERITVTARTRKGTIRRLLRVGFAATDVYVDCAGSWRVWLERRHFSGQWYVAMAKQGGERMLLPV